MREESKYALALEWVVTECMTCHWQFHQRKQSEKYGVYRQNCAPCRQKMGHPTAVDWRKTEFYFWRETP